MGMENGSQCIHGMGHMKAEYYRVLYMRMESGSQCSMGMENGSQCIHGMGHMKAEYYRVLWEWRMDHSAFMEWVI
jgi:hypothetical protein